eukprot:CAMPEP_0175166586 /NCGR_PEP_ID=MMETSP0087-20121206/27792_1 /TAXON_ID=136419 /ORGANISM="Unknown Unknown, Strain D1" /LENGTH=101 /DNA_ID=CAMNT_0016456227 /DNA_START=1 /DNA_END=302 /DNA_ORIENTATION=+
MVASWMIMKAANFFAPLAALQRLKRLELDVHEGDEGKIMDYTPLGQLANLHVLCILTHSKCLDQIRKLQPKLKKLHFLSAGEEFCLDNEGSTGIECPHPEP